jgi:hypothetical protein
MKPKSCLNRVPVIRPDTDENKGGTIMQTTDSSLASQNGQLSLSDTTIANLNDRSDVVFYGSKGRIDPDSNKSSSHVGDSHSVAHTGFHRDGRDNGEDNNPRTQNPRGKLNLKRHSIPFKNNHACPYNRSSTTFHVNFSGENYSQMAKDRFFTGFDNISGALLIDSTTRIDQSTHIELEGAQPVFRFVLWQRGRIFGMGKRTSGCSN